MKTIKKIIPLLLTAVLLLSMTAFAETAEEGAYEWPENPTETYELVTALTIAQDSPSGQALLAIDKQLREESNGAVGLDMFWESTLGSSIELGEAVSSGTVDIALITAAVISTYTSPIDVLSLPFIITNRDQAKTVVDLYFDDITEGIEETLGIPLGIWEFGYHHLFTRDKEVKTVEDMKGLTIRVMEGQLFASTFEALGAIPTNIALSELVTALQQGVVDGSELSLAAYVNQQQYTFCKYAALMGYNYSAGCPILSKDALDRYPQEVIDLVMKVFNDYKFFTIDSCAEYEERYLEKCKEEGVIITYFDEEEMDKFREAVQPVWDEYREKIGPELVDNVANAK